jgi:transposase/regulator of replication initiation timing
MSKQPSLEEFNALREEMAALQAQQEALRSERQTLIGENRVLRVERDLLKEQLARAMHKMFAAKSEARGSEQKDMFFNEAEGLAAATQAAPAQEEGGQEAQADSGSTEVAGHKRRAKRGRKPLDPALVRRVERHELPESERICPHDGSTLVEIGVEASEQIEIIPMQVQVRRDERVKYACPCCDGALRLAPRPARIIPKGLFSESALAWVISAKYEDGLPLYRQAALIGRFGGTDLSRNTMASSLVRAGQAVQPIINLMRDHLLDAPITYGDETRVQVLKEPGRAAQTHSFMWAQMTEGSGPAGTGPPIRLFSYSPSRGSEAAQLLYAGMHAGSVLMSDGYEVYNQIAQAHGLIHLGCWAHCRRYFVEAADALPKAARTPEQPALQFIDLIGQLYAVESRARERKLTPEERLIERQFHSAAVLGRIEALLLTHLHAVVPASLLGKALHYLSTQWAKLSRFVTDGSYPIDNNACENAIRPFVVGRRNWLFADTVGGAHASANLYSLLQTCKANRIDPYQYLVVLFTALPLAKTVDDYEALLPWRIALPAT